MKENYSEKAEQFNKIFYTKGLNENITKKNINLNEMFDKADNFALVKRELRLLSSKAETCDPNYIYESVRKLIKNPIKADRISRDILLKSKNQYEKDSYVRFLKNLESGKNGNALYLMREACFEYAKSCEFDYIVKELTQTEESPAMAHKQAIAMFFQRGREKEIPLKDGLRNLQFLASLSKNILNFKIW